jgi:hypothetical protein
VAKNVGIYRTPMGTAILSGKANNLHFYIPEELKTK